MLNESKALFASIQDLYLELVPLLELLEKKTKEELETMGGQQIDTAYACRESIAVLDVLKKRINKIYSIAQAIASVHITMLDKDRMSTQHATASPNPRPWFKIPYKRDKDPKEYDRLMAFCGVPQEASERETIRLHAPGFMDWMAELLGSGAALPFDPSSMTTVEHRLRITKKKDILE